MRFVDSYAQRFQRRISALVESQKFAGDDADLNRVAGDAGRIRSSAKFRAAGAEDFEFVIVERATEHCDVIHAVAVQAVGDDLYYLAARQLFGDGSEVERVAVGCVAARERERADRVDEIAAGGVNVLRRNGNRNWHQELPERN